MQKSWVVPVALAAWLSCSVLALAADWGLKEGSPGIKSAGPLAFGPDGVLIVGDTKSAAIFAIDTGDAKGEPAKVDLKITGINEKVAQTLGASAGDIRINDLAVNPETGRIFLSVTKEGSPAIVKIDEKGNLSQVKLEKIAFAKVELPNAPEDKVVETRGRKRNARDEAITDLAFVNGKVLVSGLSTSAAPSTVREIQFPFTEADPGASVEIYHGAHGKYEDYAAIRTFIPFNVDGEPTLLAGFTCTPLVKFPLDELKSGQKTRGTTVAELGNRNQPLDMISYKKDGKDFLLLANSARGVMKVTTENIARKEGITSKVADTAGQTYETIADLQGTVQLDKLSDDRAVVIRQADAGLSLATINLP